MDVQFYDDPAEFLAVAGSVLTADPVVGSVIATNSERIVRERAAGVPKPTDRPFWWATVTDGADVIGAAMRTMPNPPHPMFVLPMPDEAALLLVTTLLERGEHPGGCNGALPAARVIADETVRLRGGTVAVAMHSRLFECREVIPPKTPPGTLRPTGPADDDLVVEWCGAFDRDAAEQGGREPELGNTRDPEAVRQRILAGRRFWLFLDPDGEPAHLTGVNPPAFGVSRIGPVYTPKSHRGRGIASHVVAELTARGLAEGTRMCLFTDQANPISNKIYEAIGYRAVVDMANLKILPD